MFYRDSCFLTLDFPFTDTIQHEKWRSCILETPPKEIFALGKEKDSFDLYVRTQKPDQLVAFIGQLNNEVVKSVWANFVLEMMYFTNEDEERYSIQAHELLFRNLITSFSDPPLGYPIFETLANLEF